MGTKREVNKACRGVPPQWCHIGDATNKRDKEREQKERKRETEKERERESESEREHVDCRKRGSMCGDQKRGEESMSWRTPTVVSQW